MLISTTVTRLRPLQTHTGRAGTALAISASSSLRLRRPIQVRAFRFDLWSSYLDPTYDRELKRRYRALKHKYADNIRKLSWYEIPLTGEPKCGFKRAATRYWAADFASRWADQDKNDRRGRAPASSDTNYKIYDLLFHDQFMSPFSYKTRQDAGFQNGEKKIHGRSKMHGRFHQDNHVTKPTPQNTMQSKTNDTGDKDYVIDPITNRKVSRREPEPMKADPEPSTGTPGTDTLDLGQEGLLNLEQDRRPVYSNGKPPASELSKYAENDFDDWPTSFHSESTKPPVRQETSPSVNLSDGSESSALKNEEYSLNHLPLDDPIEEQEMPPEKTAKPFKQYGAPDKPGSQDPAPLDSSSQGGQLANELRDYGPYMYKEDSPKQSEFSDIKDLDRYSHYCPDEFKRTEEPSPPYDDLHEYVPRTADKTKDQSQLFQQYGGLEKYKTFRSRYYGAQEQRGTTMETSTLNDANSQDIDAQDISQKQGKIPKMKLPDGYIFSNDSSSHVRTETLPQDENRLSSKSDEASSEDLQQPSSSPAAFKDTVSQHYQNTVQGEEPKQPENSEKTIPGGAENLPRNISKLKPSVIRLGSAMKGSRLNRAVGADLYSKEPQGLETSFSKECGGRHTMPLYARRYGSEPVKESSEFELAIKNEEKQVPEQVPESSSGLYYHRDPEIDGIPSSESNKPRDQKAAQPDEPTVYKVLAYDPVSQTINIAETASVAPDYASPLSPTEVLLRLSNPTKFLPHFAPLQDEGFEIVSGGGHVLVFRQARPAKAGTHDGTPYVNPIDMMGRPAAVPNPAAFVSPTGFVNYDIPRVEEELPEQPPSPLHVNARRPRREEAAFSGQRLSSENGKKRSEKGKSSRMNLGERVIVGGAWVAGISYALGVVIEYFYTGGTDGKGPIGFSPS